MMLAESVVVAWGAFACFIAAHLAIARWMRPSGVVGPSARLILVALGALAWWVSAAPGWSAAARANCLLHFGSLWVLYMILVIHVVRSVSIRTMVELAGASGGHLSAHVLETLYDAGESFDGRVDTLVNSGFLREHEGRLAVTGKGALVAGFFHGVRKLLNLQSYG